MCYLYLLFVFFSSYIVILVKFSGVIFKILPLGNRIVKGLWLNLTITVLDSMTGTVSLFHFGERVRTSSLVSAAL